MKAELTARLPEWKTVSPPLFRTALVGVPLAAVSFVALLMVSGGLMTAADPDWVGESMFAAVGATTWMTIGLLAGRPTRMSALLLFGLGAVASWVLTLRLVHSVSIYYGMTQFLVACGAGIFTGTVILRSRTQTSLVPWIAGAVGIAAFGVVWHLWTNPPGDARRLRDAAGVQHRVGIFGQPGQGFVWVPRGAAIQSEPGAATAVTIEFDPGSGHQAVSLTPVTDPASLAAAARLAAGNERARIASDIEQGSIPGFLRNRPMPLAMHRGTVWRIER